MKGWLDDLDKSGTIRVFVLVTLVILFLSLSGCTHTNTGFTVRPQVFTSSPYVTVDENMMDVTLPLNESMLVSYPWTPEDGRYWRVSVSQGLFVSGDRYVPYPADIPVEVSGTREWMVKAISPGTQTFIGHLRPRSNSWNQEILQYKIMVNVTDEMVRSQENQT